MKEILPLIGGGVCGFGFSVLFIWMGLDGDEEFLRTQPRMNGFLNMFGLTAARVLYVLLGVVVAISTLLFLVHVARAD